MTKTYPQEFDLIVQSLSTVMLINAMGPTGPSDASDHLRRSDFYKGLELHPWAKWVIDQTGIGNRGFALMSLYALLVLPRELIADRYKSDYDAIEAEMPSWTQNTVNVGYSSVQYIRHIRNAVAHGRVEFVTKSVIRFHDKGTEYGPNRKQCSGCNKWERDRIDCEFSTEIELSKLDAFLARLRAIHIKYIQDYQ